MDDKIIFLGTAGDHHTVGKQLRASGGVVFQVDGVQMHVNPGPGSLIRANQYGVNVRENAVVMATSGHLQYCNDMNAVINAMTYNGLDQKGVLISNDTVVNGSEGGFAFLHPSQRKFVERVVVLKNGQKVGIENFEITSLKALNDDEHAMGIKIATQHYTVCYSGDTSFRSDLMDEYMGSDVLILHVQSPEHHQKGHLSITDASKIISKVKPKLAILTGFGLRMLKSDPLYEARRIQQDTGVHTIAAKDGMVISPNTHSSEIRQQTLRAFTRKEVSAVDKKEDVDESENHSVV